MLLIMLYLNASRMDEWENVFFVGLLPRPFEMPDSHQAAFKILHLDIWLHLVLEDRAQQ